MIPLIQAKHCGPARPGVQITLLIVHTMEAPEKPGTARGVANWFAGDTSPMASAHYCIDSQEIIQCVMEDVVAWAAPGANKNGIHLEHAGYAAQTIPQWGDDYSMAVLARSAALAADICARHGIPIVKLTAADLKQGGARGICGHFDVTFGLNGGKGHTDPGVMFPWPSYLAAIRAAMPKPDGEPDAVA